MSWSWWRQKPKKSVRSLVAGDRVIIDRSEYTVASRHYCNGDHGTRMLLTQAENGKSCCAVQLTFVGVDEPFYASPAMMLTLAVR